MNNLNEQTPPKKFEMNNFEQDEQSQIVMKKPQISAKKPVLSMAGTHRAEEIRQMIAKVNEQILTARETVK